MSRGCCSFPGTSPDLLLFERVARRLLFRGCRPARPLPGLPALQRRVLSLPTSLLALQRRVLSLPAGLFFPSPEARTARPWPDGSSSRSARRSRSARAAMRAAGRSRSARSGRRPGWSTRTCSRSIRRPPSLPRRWRRGWCGSTRPARSSRRWPRAGSSRTTGCATPSGSAARPGPTAARSPPSRSRAGCAPPPAGPAATP